jgi:hypothetical protein
VRVAYQRICLYNIYSRHWLHQTYWLWSAFNNGVQTKKTGPHTEAQYHAQIGMSEMYCGLINSREKYNFYRKIKHPSSVSRFDTAARQRTLARWTTELIPEKQTKIYAWGWWCIVLPPELTRLLCGLIAFYTHRLTSSLLHDELLVRWNRSNREYKLNAARGSSFHNFESPHFVEQTFSLLVKLMLFKFVFFAFYYRVCFASQLTAIIINYWSDACGGATEH